MWYNAKIAIFFKKSPFQGKKKAGFLNWFPACQ